MKKDYEELFGIIREGADRIFQDDFFPDDEIGYLVLYFAVSLDKVMKRSFRILVVCSGGMGSSKMLAHRVEQEIPEICVSKEVSLVGFGQENLDEYDLILSTIIVAPASPAPMIKVFTISASVLCFPPYRMAI